LSTHTSIPSKPGERRIGAVGRVLLWKGGSVWIGRNVGGAELHSHYAIQVTLALDGEFLIRPEESDEWQKTRGAIVHSEVRHEFDGCGSTLCVMFVEPEGVQGRALRARFRGPIATDVRVEDMREQIDALARAFAQRHTDALVLQNARAVLDRLTAVEEPLSSPDSRVTAAMQWIREHLSSDVSLEDAAASVHLSPSRFRHLFVAQTGISFRAYLRWARVESAVGAAFAGKTWTEAAQEAGFADSAHLSRTCRHMFGMSPTMLVPE
jgi:AraC family transcriptional regulator